MARARTADSPRSRSKSVLVEEITHGIGKFQEVLTAIDDLCQEGFPYHDAARAKIELQLRECVRRIFGERSPEYQTHRHHKLRTSNKAETAQSVALVKGFIQTLEDKKLELQGLKPPPPVDPAAEKHSAAPPPLSLVPPTAQVTIAPRPTSVASPMTLSVAMTTNLETPSAPALTTPQPPNSRQETLSSPPASQASIPPTTAPVAQPLPSSHDQTTATATPLQAALPAPLAPASSPSAPERPSAVQTARDIQSIQSRSEQDPLELLRKVCFRFHGVARQLRLRKDYRATLEVEDDHDLQDLLCALLKMEFDEVGADEWTPPYTGGTPRTTLFLNGEQIAVVAKKTRSGLTTKELADQVAADSACYTTRDRCTTLFCFIYDPEGRIGSPKRLETDLTSVSDRYTVEVLVAPK